MEHFATIPTCLPFEIYPEGATTAILLIHGYTGGPRNLRYLATKLGKAGFAVVVPRLPGAGTDMSDLSTTGRRDWRRRVYDTWQDVRSRFDTVYIAGYSMGGSLALDLASKVGTDKLILLAPAVRITHRTLWIVPLIRPILPLIPLVKTDWSPEPEDDEETVEFGRRYWSRRDLRSAGHLYKLGREALRKAAGIRAAVMILIATHDESVPTKVLKLIDQKLPQGVDHSLVLHNCRHDLPQGADRDTVADGIIAWLNGLQPAAADSEIQADSNQPVRVGTLPAS